MNLEIRLLAICVAAVLSGTAALASEPAEFKRMEWDAGIGIGMSRPTMIDGLVVPQQYSTSLSVSSRLRYCITPHWSVYFKVMALLASGETGDNAYIVPDGWLMTDCRTDIPKYGATCVIGASYSWHYKRIELRPSIGIGKGFALSPDGAFYSCLLKQEGTHLVESVRAEHEGFPDAFVLMPEVSILWHVSRRIALAFTVDYAARLHNGEIDCVRRNAYTGVETGRSTHAYNIGNYCSVSLGFVLKFGKTSRF